MTRRNVLWRIGAGGIGWLLILHGCSPASIKNTARTYTVEIKQMQFQPNVLHVQKGDTVLFINQDMVAHNATEATAKRLASPTLKSGDSSKVAVTQSVDYYCTIHPVMKGKIIVE